MDIQIVRILHTLHTTGYTLSTVCNIHVFGYNNMGYNNRSSHTLNIGRSSVYKREQFVDLAKCSIHFLY